MTKIIQLNNVAKANDLNDHIADHNNPHAVTKTQVGLQFADNTSDANKPVSTAQQAALDLKLNKNATITGATKTKITYDSNGLVTAGADATTSDISEGSNLYWTNARTIASVLTGFAAAVTYSAITATDSILIALGKIQKKINDLGGASLLNVGTAAGTVAAGDDSRLTNTRFQRALAKNYASNASTNTTAEEIILSMQVAAGTILPGDFLELVAMCRTVSAAGSKTFRMYICPTASLSDPGLAQIGIAANITTGTPSFFFRRHIIVLSDTSIKTVIAGNHSYYNDDIIQNSPVTTAAVVSLAAGFYFLITSQKSVGTEVTSVEACCVELIR